MFGWFKKSAPQPSGPDFSGVDSPAKAAELFRRGDLEKLFLMPPEYGGADSPINTLYVPVGVGAVKARIDTNVIGPLVEAGRVTQYKALAEYQGNSVIPIAIKITASDPGGFTTTINIWGEALTRDPPAGQGGPAGGSPNPPGTGTMGEAEYRGLLDRGMDELRAKTNALDEAWGFAEAGWAVDQGAGVITFTARGRKITAPVQIIGTYNTTNGSWLWSWANPSISDQLTRDARQVQEFGARHGLGELTNRGMSCDEFAAWEFAALACHLVGATGAYRGPAGDTMVFMTFGPVTVS